MVVMTKNEQLKANGGYYTALCCCNRRWTRTSKAEAATEAGKHCFKNGGPANGHRWIWL